MCARARVGEREIGERAKCPGGGGTHELLMEKYKIIIRMHYLWETNGCIKP